MIPLKKLMKMYLVYLNSLDQLKIKHDLIIIHQVQFLHILE